MDRYWNGAPKFPISVSSRSGNICADLCKVKRSCGWVLTSTPLLCNHRSRVETRTCAAAQRNSLPPRQAQLLKTNRARPSVSDYFLCFSCGSVLQRHCAKPLTPTCRFSARNTLVRIAKLACNEILKIRKKFVPLEKKRHSGSSLAALCDIVRESETKRC